MDTLNLVLNKMPLHFSSNQFAILAKKHGLTKRDVENGIVSHYLKKHAIRDDMSRRMWYKDQTMQRNEINTALLNSAIKMDDESIKSQIEAAIKLLKSHGYKILEPKTEWQEV